MLGVVDHIRSLGLTILAVAKGKFPLSGMRSSPSSDDDDDDKDEEREKDGILDHQQQQQQQNKRASNRKKKSQDEEALGASNGCDRRGGGLLGHDQGEQDRARLLRRPMRVCQHNAITTFVCLLLFRECWTLLRCAWISIYPMFNV